MGAATKFIIRVHPEKTARLNTPRLLPWKAWFLTGLVFDHARSMEDNRVGKRAFIAKSGNDAGVMAVTPWPIAANNRITLTIGNVNIPAVVSSIMTKPPFQLVEIEKLDERFDK